MKRNNSLTQKLTPKKAAILSGALLAVLSFGAVPAAGALSVDNANLGSGLTLQGEDGEWTQGALRVASTDDLDNLGIGTVLTSQDEDGNSASLGTILESTDNEDNNRGDVNLNAKDEDGNQAGINAGGSSWDQNLDQTELHGDVRAQDEDGNMADYGIHFSFDNLQ